MRKKDLQGRIVNTILNNEKIPFHMPGHKRNPRFIPSEIGKFDVTEIDGFDELGNPKGILKDLEKEFARLFNKEEALLSINGSTGLILASLQMVGKDEDKILCVRNGHKSMYAGLAFAGLHPIYIDPPFSNFPLPPTSLEIKKYLDKYKDIKALFITSPTYEGVVADLENIYKICKEKDVLLIVDAAHGASFPFLDIFPKNPALYGDIVIMSLHKTLPFMNQLAIGFTSEKVSLSGFRNMLNMIQTSSPSYLLLAQSEDGLSSLTKENFSYYKENLLKVREALSSYLFTKEKLVSYNKEYEEFDLDIGKLVFLCDNGYKANKALLEENIAFELIRENYILGMTSLADKRESIDYLIKTIGKLYKEEKIKYTKDREILENIVISPRQVYLPRKAMYMEKEWVLLKESLGRISASFIIPYPPGIPLFCPGEEINKESLSYIESIRKKHSIHGLKNEKIECLIE